MKLVVLVGHNTGTVSNCNTNGNTTGNYSIGGLIGYNDRTVSNCYSTGFVTGEYDIGGLVGYNDRTISNCYSTVFVSGNYSTGGTVDQDEETVLNSFWDVDTSSTKFKLRRFGKDHKRNEDSKSTFTGAGWDFENTWSIIEDTTYPFFRWQDTDSPKANAGQDQTVNEGTTVFFDGSGSSDIIGIANWTWTFTDDKSVHLYGEKPTYRFDNPGVYIVTLNVTDAVSYWDIDTINVTVLDITTPIVNAGPDHIINEGMEVSFDGKASSDNVKITNWTWTFTDGNPVFLYGVITTYLFNDPGLFIGH